MLFWYRIDSVLGQGGFGITYRAYDTNLQRDVAIKEYLPTGVAVREPSQKLHPVSDQHSEHYGWGLERFLGEARVLARFNHPNIVRVLSVFEANNTAYMIMEYERGESLSLQLRDRGLVYDELGATRLALALMSGLESVHAAGFIHRDVKPGNILIRDDGSAVLIDFGSARYALGDRTQMLTAIVSPGYAPYEQYEGSGERQGPWTDIYGLGASLYVMASGSKPPAEAIARGNARIQGKPDPYLPATVIGRGRYSQRFLQAVDAALAFTHDERPATIADWRAMFPALDGTPAPAGAGAAATLRPLVRRLLDNLRGGLPGGRGRGAGRRPSRARARQRMETARIPLGERRPGTVFRDPLGNGQPGPEMVVLPPGRFRMGDTRGGAAASEGPIHLVSIGYVIAIGVAPVTIGDFRRFAAAAAGGRMPDDHGWSEDDRPVINVSWREATQYAQWLARETGLGYTLPSEAEWEYAARAGTETSYWWGDEVGVGRANCDGCGSDWDNLQTSPVGSFAANAFGVADMLGNVWEWVEDTWHPRYAGAPSSGEPWLDGNQSLRVARGGAWNYEPRHVRCASRVGYTLDHRSSSLGFRVALRL